MRKARALVKPIRIVILLATIGAITAVPSGRPASAVLEGLPIQPGAPMVDGANYFQGFFCTLNFVFKDKAKKNTKTYIGTANGCTTHFGERVRSPRVGVFGTVVYRKESYASSDFALIQIDRDKLKYVSRIMRGFGAAPKGYTTSRGTNTGDPLVTHGYPYGAMHGAQAVTRVGVLGDDNPTRYWSAVLPNIQDRGSPVIRADGKAVGMSDEITPIWGTWLPGTQPTVGYATIEGLLAQLRSAGFNVTL